MMEAACAYYEATGKDRLLRVMEKNAEHIYRHFIVEGHEGFPGHPEVELALLKLYRATGNEQCLALAEHFINVRGVDSHFTKRIQSPGMEYLELRPLQYPVHPKPSARAQPV